MMMSGLIILIKGTPAAFMAVSSTRSPKLPKVMSAANNISGILGRIKAVATNRFGNDSRVINNYSKDYAAQLSKYNPIMICVNDSERANAEDSKRLAEFLKKLYPAKSSFEK